MTPDAAKAGTLSYGMAQVPQPAPPMSVPPLGATAPPFTPFTGQAPTPTPYGTFTAPDPSTFQQDPSYQFRLNEGQKALQRSAMARGTLLSGGFAKALQNYGQGAASQEYGNAFNRALAGYTTNRDTNAQNFGQQLGSYNAQLGGYTANTNAQLGYGRLGLETAEANRGAAYQDARDQRDYQQQVNDYNTTRANVAQQSADQEYARQVEATRAQNAAESARMRGGVASTATNRRVPFTVLPKYAGRA